jgi:hypothetical protein
VSDVTHSVPPTRGRGRRFSADPVEADDDRGVLQVRVRDLVKPAEMSDQDRGPPFRELPDLPVAEQES